MKDLTLPPLTQPRNYTTSPGKTIFITCDTIILFIKCQNTILTYECVIYVSYLVGRVWPGENIAAPLHNCFGSPERGQHYSITWHCSC